jgi:hypothetical protein
LSAIHAWFIRWITEIAVTDKRVIYKRGFINRHIVSISAADAAGPASSNALNERRVVRSSRTAGIFQAPKRRHFSHLRHRKMNFHTLASEPL